MTTISNLGANPGTNSGRPAHAGVLAVVSVPFRALGRLMVHLSGISRQMQALNRLTELSDQQLAAKGLTRDGEIRRILGASAAI